MDPNQDKHMPELFKYPLNELPLSRDILSEDEIEKIKELLLIDKLSPSSLYYLFDSYWNPIKNIFSFETADDILHLEDLGVERLLLINEPENQNQIFTSCSLSQISRDNIFADKELGGLEFRSKPASKKIKGKLKLIDHLKISPNRNICNKFLHPNVIAEQADLATPYLKKVFFGIYKPIGAP
ncbi:unnamed protein product [Moneuplotes crassus]|uniref:Uncharacterized protein n=1 Tax=Euplotes crassus TaxID=5936 RepID=A0AAD1U6M0_EUPCR|nr:unnamed protein product [Moneuplotes crassus]